MLKPDLSSICGLEWIENWRAVNGKGSYVVPFPRLRPWNVVFHGENAFSYGHYGIHLGQQDTLTFLGDPNRIITARFIDCRINSPSKREFLEVRFSPSSRWALCVPPGVAHDFEGLEYIYTINNYYSFLPDPQAWLDGDTEWDSDADVLNINLDSDPNTVRLLKHNAEPASDVYYNLIAEKQRLSLKDMIHSYPYTEKYVDDMGSTHILKIYESSEYKDAPDWTDIGDITGLGWARNPYISSGKNSGFIPRIDRRPYYIVDHGYNLPYTHDAYGIHLGQTDYLTFLGESSHNVTVEFVDCRRGSPTLHRMIKITFNPDPLKTLVIPCGVAHRFEQLQGVYTVNQGELFTSASGTYEPGTDVIDWPIDQRPFPSLTPNETPADYGFYADMVAAQRKLIEGASDTSTPVILIAQDSSGQDVRVAIRSRA